MTFPRNHERRLLSVNEAKTGQRTHEQGLAQVFQFLKGTDFPVDDFSQCRDEMDAAFLEPCVRRMIEKLRIGGNGAE